MLPVEEAPAAQIEKPAVKPVPPKPDPVVVKKAKASGKVEKPATPAKARAEKPVVKKSPAKRPAEKKITEKKPKAKPAGAAKAKKVAKAPVRKPAQKSSRSARK